MIISVRSVLRIVKQFLAVLLIGFLVYQLLAACSGLITFPQNHRAPWIKSVPVDSPEQAFFDRLRAFYTAGD